MPDFILLNSLNLFLLSPSSTPEGVKFNFLTLPVHLTGDGRVRVYAGRGHGNRGHGPDYRLQLFRARLRPAKRQTKGMAPIQHLGRWKREFFGLPTMPAANKVYPPRPGPALAACASTHTEEMLSNTPSSAALTRMANPPSIVSSRLIPIHLPETGKISGAGLV
jgi:hypothetical protein